MPNQKILYVTSEMYPYQDDSAIANMVNRMALKMHQEGNDVRVFMPKFGPISERKFQLHEVIRLSGMNIIINDLDQPLIIKVASLPGERLQVYFIDNEEYFKRKFFYFDEEGQPFVDNDERGMFFARGVIETVKKLNWVPDIIHLNGWMAAFLPLYLEKYYQGDTYFASTRFITSLYNEKEFDFSAGVQKKLAFDKIDQMAGIKKLNNTDLKLASLSQMDLILMGDEFLKEDLEKAFKDFDGKRSEYVEADQIQKVYDQL